MSPLLTLLEAVEFEAFRKRMPRPALLRQVGITEAHFNDVIGGRAALTKEEQRRIGELIPMPLHELLAPGPSRRLRQGARLASREQR